MPVSPSIEKEYKVNLYINSNKMQNNLIYIKNQLNKEGLLVLENLVIILIRWFYCLIIFII